MNLFKALLKLTPDAKLVPSFSDQSKPDWSFTVAGLKFAGHSDGLPIYAASYITVGHTHQAPVSAVPEPATWLLMAVAIGAVAVWKKAWN